MAEVGEILEGFFAVTVVEKIGNDNYQAALGIRADKFADRSQVIRRACRFVGGESIHYSGETMTAAGGHHAGSEARSEALNLDRIEAHEADVAECAGEFSCEIEFRAAVGEHGIAGVEQE